MDAFIRRFLSDEESASSGGSLIHFRVLATSQVSTAFLSLVSSATMATMIANTEKGLTTPYRRIIFGLSISDIAQSLSLFIGPFALPHEVDAWGIGNPRTCQGAGFLLVVGVAAVPMYTCFLCYYYLCKLKFRMDNKVFARRVERKIHAFIILFTFLQAIVALALNTIHPAIFKTCCAIVAIPLGCRLIPEIVGECDPVTYPRVNNFIILNHFILTPLCLFGMIGIMIRLSYHAMILNRMTPPTSNGPTTSHRLSNRAREVQNIDASMISTIVTLEETNIKKNESNVVMENGVNQQNSPIHVDRQSSGVEGIDNVLDSMLSSSEMEESVEVSPAQRRNVFPLNNVGDGEGPQSQPQAPEESTQSQPPVQNRARHLSTLYKNETLLQGFLYVGSFCLVYLPVIYTYAHGIAQTAPPKLIQASVFFIWPLGSLLNILVYTRPQAASLRRDHPSLSRLRCIWLVLRAGGEIPTLPELETNNDAMNISNQAPVEQQESMSEIQIGLASRPPSELVINGVHSNISGTSESNPGGNTANARLCGTGASRRMDTVSELTNPNFNLHTNTQNLESFQEHDRQKSPSRDV